MKAKRYIVLGANGFLGSHISAYLHKNNFQATALTRADLDFLKPETYAVADFSNSVIFDCIAKINGTREELELTNNRGLENFLNSLINKHHNFTYIYFSTISTLYPDMVFKNDYVASKFNAECFIKKEISNYKIIRLTFPFGRGESPNRLFSRLINKLKKNEELIIDDLRINITPIASLVQWLPELTGSNRKEMNFTDGQAYALSEIVDYIAGETSSASAITVNHKNTIDLTVEPYAEGISFQPDVYKTLHKMIHEN